MPTGKRFPVMLPVPKLKREKDQRSETSPERATGLKKKRKER